MQKLPKHLRQALYASVFAAAVVVAGPASAQTAGRQLATFPSAPPGCDGTTVGPALSTAGNYNYAQQYSTTFGLIHQPTSYFGCLQNLLNEANTLLNMFNGTGNFNIGALLTQLAQAAVRELINQLMTQVCSAANSVLSNTGAAAPLLQYLHTTP